MPVNAGDILYRRIDSPIKLKSFMHKQIIGVKKNVSSIKILAELGRIPLKINIEIQMFKYLQRFAFIEKERYVSRLFQAENQAIDGWVKDMKTKLELTGNMYKVISGEI